MKIGFNSNQSFCNLLYIYKFVFVILSEYVFSRFIKLGDTIDYLNTPFFFDFRVFFSSTRLIEFLGSIFTFLPGFLQHIPLAILPILAIKYFLSQMTVVNIYFGRVQRFIIFLILIMPNVGVWTSIHSKESIGFFFVTVITTFLIKCLVLYRFKPDLITLLSIYLCLIFKPQYFAAFLSVFFYIFFIRYFKFQPFIKLLIFAFFILLQVFLLYILVDFIDKYAFLMHSHFNTDTATSTRDNLFLEPGDFFRNAPYGMFIAFWGPTVSEVLTSPFKIFAFSESIIITCIIFYLLFNIFSSVLLGRLNIVLFSIVFLSFFWLLFFHYPFGVFNAGSALRYRSNFIPFLILFLISLHNLYKIRGKL